MRKAIGIIPDGNRRFSKKESIELEKAYEMGLKKVLEVLEWSAENGFTDVILFGLSTYNFNRPKKDLDALFSCFKRLDEITNKLNDEKSKYIWNVKFIGKHVLVPEKVEKALNKIEETMKKRRERENPTHNLWICFSYDGHSDIIKAVNKLIEKKVEITKESLAQHLSTAGIPFPEIILRTGGNSRLSGFLLWEASYAELVVADELFPELTVEKFESLIKKARKSISTIGI